MSRKSLLCGLALGTLVASCGWVFGTTAASSAEPEAGALLAEWKGGGVTVADYMSWWHYGSQASRPALSTLEDKQKFLDTVINAKLMMDEAESLGITQLPTVADFWKGRRMGMLTESVLMRATEGRTTADPRDIEDVYRKRLTEMEIKLITVKTKEEALALEDSIKAGIPFEDLARRYSISPSGERGGEVGTVRWGDFSEVWSAHAFGLEPGQVSEPFELSDGYTIMKAYSKELVEPADPAAEKARIRTLLERDLAVKERTAYLDSLKMAYGYNIDMRAVISLCSEYARKIGALEERSTVIDEDVTPELTPSQKAIPIVTFKGNSLSEGLLVAAIQRTPFEVRPKVDDAEDLLPFIDKLGVDSLLVAEGEKLGLDKDPALVGAVERAKRRKTLFAFYDYVGRDASVPPEEAKKFYDDNVSLFQVPDGYTISKIVVNTKEAADSVLMRLNRGEPFEDIAKVRSRDPFTAPQGGNVGFLKKGDDPEFDGFLATMEPGETRAFRSLEGFVILWLRERHQPRTATYEEALPSIDQRLLQNYRDQAVTNWVADRRAQVGVKVNTPILESLVVKD